MPNDYDSNPIFIDTDMASGWRALQTLNTGNLQPTIQNPGPITRQWGVRAYAIGFALVSTQASGTILVADPNDNTILFKQFIPASGTFATEFTFDAAYGMWRDFKITGPTATGVAVQVWYRA